MKIEIANKEDFVSQAQVRKMEYLLNKMDEDELERFKKHHKFVKLKYNQK